MVAMISGFDGAVLTAPLPSLWHLANAPHSLRQQAETGQTLSADDPGHADSWGIGWFDVPGRVSLVRQTGSAATSGYYYLTAAMVEKAREEETPCVLIGHLRKAVCGAIISENAHPVRADYANPNNPEVPYESLLVAHNGTVRPPLLDTLRDDLLGWEQANSDNDTVVLTAWLARALEAHPTNPFLTLQTALHELLTRAERVAPEGDITGSYSGLNLLIGVAGGLLVLRQFSKNPEYYTLWTRRFTDTEGVAGGWVIASEPTDSEDGWELIEPGVLSYYSVSNSEPQTARIGVK
jgi:predicted glutamine amidotransferase